VRVKESSHHEIEEGKKGLVCVCVKRLVVGGMKEDIGPSIDGEWEIRQIKGIPGRILQRKKEEEEKISQNNWTSRI